MIKSRLKTIRIPKPLHEEITKDLELKGFTLNNFIKIAVENFIDLFEGNKITTLKKIVLLNEPIEEYEFQGIQSFKRIPLEEPKIVLAGVRFNRIKTFKINRIVAQLQEMFCSSEINYTSIINGLMYRYMELDEFNKNEILGIPQPSVSVTG